METLGHTDVAKACTEAPGWVALFATLTGQYTEPEMDARARQHNPPDFALSKAMDMRGKP